MAGATGARWADNSPGRFPELGDRNGLKPAERTEHQFLGLAEPKGIAERFTDLLLEKANVKPAV